ncbi:MAG: hypothetical protein IT285_14140 [Bdellovibrionales bacterium]|nr:hypothetical protein [Bdellovibrionales bacterium]
MRKALGALDARLTVDVSLLVGGGGAMVLAHCFKLSTMDIDAVPKGISLVDLDVHVKAVATELRLPPDWLNPYYGSFTHTLPADFESRVVEVFRGKRLTARALGGWVGRRQAERDLRRFGCRSRGRTKDRVYQSPPKTTPPTPRRRLR